MIKEAIAQVVAGKDLDAQTAKEAMSEMFDGTATQAQIAAFITGLRMKGETVTEITACANVMREKGIRVQPSTEVMEIVGTGGDLVGTFNISTTSAFVIAAAGVPVAKHGNRSVSSKSGAADVLEQLGATITLEPDQMMKVLDEAGICFLFAQKYHSSMKYAAPVRKELGIRTIFNILGPLTNPAAAKMQVMGVYDQKLVEPLAQVLSNLGVTRGVVVCGSDGIDEVTLTGPTTVCEIREGDLHTYELSPEVFGLKLCKLEDLIGGTPQENAQITRDILSGKEKGPKRDDVILNAALAIYLGVDGISMADAVNKAKETIDSGKALETLDRFVSATNKYAEISA